MEQWQEYLEAAEKGDVIMQDKVATAYMKGNGVEKNIEQALKYFRMSAENGSGLGNYQLGKAYEKGNGVPQNMDKAIEYYEKSAALGYLNAQNILKQLKQKEEKGISADKSSDFETKNESGAYCAPPLPEQMNPGAAAGKGQESQKTKSKVCAALLAFFLGPIGIHNFYLGYVVKGIIQLILTLTGFGAIVSLIWAFAEFIMILTGKIAQDKKGNPII